MAAERVPGRRALVLVNRGSRNGDADLQAGLELLREWGFELVVEAGEQPQRMRELIRERAGELDCVIVGGGDGTLNCMAGAVLDSGLPLGILPMGTANDLARTLGIPDDLVDACRVIAEGRLHPIDLGRVNDVHFFNVASIGLGVRVAHKLTKDLKRRWGVLGYLHGFIQAYQEHRPFKVDIVCDGQARRVRSIQVAVGNGRHYGGGMTIAEEAEIDDGLFFLYSLKPLRFWELALVAPVLRNGQRDPQRLLLMKGRDIELRTRKPMDVDTDGELTTRTPARFTLLAGALRVYVPESYGRVSS